MEITINANDIDLVKKCIKSINRKAEKCGCAPVVASFSKPYATSVRVCKVDHASNTVYTKSTITVEAVDVRIDNEIIKNDGWTVEAHLEHLEGGNVVTLIGAKVINPSWVDLPAKCDHCNTNHRRSKTYIVSKSGEEKQVGSSCLKEYTGIDPALALKFAALHDMVLDDEINAGCIQGRYTVAHDIKTVVANAIDIIANYGYVKSAEPDSTKSKLFEMVDNETLTENARIKAQAIITWLQANDFTGDSLLTNCKALAINQYCKSSHFGYLAYLPVAYDKAMKKAKTDASKAEQTSMSEHYGAVGEKINVSISDAKLITSYETQFGYTFVYQFISDSNIFIWYASRSQNIEKITSLQGTIKCYKEYNSAKQTVLTRCKIK